MIWVQLAVLFCIMILTLITCAIAIIRVCNGKPLYTRQTTNKITALLEEERELYFKVSKEIEDAGIINKFFLKKKLGPLYEWYTGGYIK